MLAYAFVWSLGLVAGCISGIIGTGSSTWIRQLNAPEERARRGAGKA